MAEQTLRKFADHTRMSEADRNNVTGIAQRYLALHVDQVPCAAVYAFVAADYDAMALRTYSPPLEVAYTKQELDKDTLTFICKNNLNKPYEIEGGIFEAFRKAVLPRPVGEEQWKTMERPEQWKELAYFLGNPHMVASIYHDPKTSWSNADNTEAYAIMDRMKQFHACASPLDIAKEIGAMISNIVLPIGILNLSEKASPREPASNTLVVEEARHKVMEIKVHQQQEQHIAQTESLRPRLEAFRKRTGLPATVETKRLLKQLLFSLAEAPIGASQVKATLGPYQKELPKVEKGSDEQLVASEYIESQSWNHFHPNDSKRAQAIATVCSKRDWSACELMKHAVMPETCLNSRLLNKYQQMGVAKEIDVEFLDAIGSL